MINGFYTASAGMLGQIEQQDAISNNLANINTPGYKRSSVSFSAFEAELANATRSRAGSLPLSTGCVIPVPEAGRDSSQGMIEDTSNPTNLAIDGPGSFVVSTPSGPQLTRGGNFTLDESGRLVTNQGYPVLGENGPIRVSGPDWSVDSSGRIHSNGRVVERLRIETETPARVGSQSDKPGRVIQGRVENSNVSAIQEMVSMLTALRTYEASQRTVQSIDQTLDKAINTMGRTS